MFIGHWAPALAAAAATRKAPPLAVLFIGAQLIDWAFFAFLLLGVEHMRFSPGISDLDQEKIELFLDNVHVVTRGGRNPAYREEQGQQVMKQSEITVRVNLGRGTASDTVWTCDFSHDYVSINADYRS